MPCGLFKKYPRLPNAISAYWSIGSMIVWTWSLKETAPARWERQSRQPLGRFSSSKGPWGYSPDLNRFHSRQFVPLFPFWNLSDYMALGRDHASRFGHGTAFSIPIPKAGPCCNGLGRMFWRAIFGPPLRGADRVTGMLARPAPSKWLPLGQVDRDGTGDGRSAIWQLCKLESVSRRTHLRGH